VVKILRHSLRPSPYNFAKFITEGWQLQYIFQPHGSVVFASAFAVSLHVVCALKDKLATPLRVFRG